MMAVKMREGLNTTDAKRRAAHESCATHAAKPLAAVLETRGTAQAEGRGYARFLAHPGLQGLRRRP